MNVPISDLEYGDQILDIVDSLGTGNSARWAIEEKIKEIRANILAESEAFRARAAELIGEES